MKLSRPTICEPWDAYAVWQILLHRHPVQVEDPSGSCGRIERETLAEFCEAIVEYPDYLQDAVLVIAHAEGPEAAVAALDNAVREYLVTRRSESSAPVRGELKQLAG
jgi:hypothetical protein